MLALYDDLQVGRIPFFFYNRERLVVADLAGGNGKGITRALRTDAVDRFGAQGFLDHIGVIAAMRALVRRIRRISTLAAVRMVPHLIRHLPAWVEHVNCA